MLTPEEGRIALHLARSAIEAALSGKKIAVHDLPPVFSERRGVFVTLKRQGYLRGCIGFPYPTQPLGDAIVDAAIAAAFEDPRFPPVSWREIADINLEVTVLTEPRPLRCPPEQRPNHVQVGKHGLIISGLGTSGLLLPQVPVEQGWTSREFLDQTCIKAGLPPGCWRRDDVIVQTFEGQVFKEQAV